MRKIFNEIIILIFFFTTACGGSWESIKKGLGGQKRTSTDEFLVKKKYPLTLPPKFDALPEPGQNMNLGDSGDEEVTDIEQLIQQGSDQTSLSDLKQSGNVEDSILEKIKQK